MNQLQKTQGVCPDYHYLDNPFPEEDHEKETILGLDEAYAIIAGDELNSLQEAKNSPDWPEWHVSIDEELKLLNKMGWQLVDKLPEAIAIPNKWTFVKKHNKGGRIV